MGTRIKEDCYIKVKRTIQKVARQNFAVSIYDTFKVDATRDEVW